MRAGLLLGRSRAVDRHAQRPAADALAHGAVVCADDSLVRAHQRRLELVMRHEPVASLAAAAVGSDGSSAPNVRRGRRLPVEHPSVGRHHRVQRRSAGREVRVLPKAVREHAPEPLPELPVGRPALQRAPHVPDFLAELEQVLFPGLLARRRHPAVLADGRRVDEDARRGRDAGLVAALRRAPIRDCAVRREVAHLPLLGLELVDPGLKLGHLGLQRRGVLLLPLAVSLLHRSLVASRGSRLLAVFPVPVVAVDARGEAHRGDVVEAEREQSVAHDAVVELVRKRSRHRRGIYDESVVGAAAGEGAEVAHRGIRGVHRLEILAVGFVLG
mmetsp:Transcript_14261/g.56273  ORF Transcript_14261/g.56273 Transcript_14261/m.56273 type:complete len:329 (-) Transcript_14261:41-1027(-)